MLPPWPTASPDASRPRPGVLTPSSEGSLNQRPPQSSGKMRQSVHRDSNALEHLLKPSIVVKPHPPNVLSKPCALQPLMLLPREALSLSLLDLAAPNGELPRSRLYESHVKILDLEDRMGEKPSILIARNESTRSLYAVERSDSKLFTLCKLGSWVDPSKLAADATVAIPQLLDLHETKPGQHRPVPLTTPQLHKEHKEKRLAIEALQSVVRKRGRSRSASTFDDAAHTDKRLRSDGSTSRPSSSCAPEPMPRTENLRNSSNLDKMTNTAELLDTPPTPMPPTVPEFPTQPTAEAIQENIRSQYQEALYRSKGSLAYFAKGPLSRARAAFHLDCEGTLSMNDLVTFLKSLIMTTVQIDKKYRETIPDLISKSKTLVESSNEGTRKRKKARKMKLSKMGLYPCEANQVLRWWSANKPETLDDEASISPAEVKSYVDLLRTRETQLQMILILETLALEPLRTREDLEESQLPGFGAETEVSQFTETIPAKKRSKHNLPVLIEIHADRLCIWQSTASDEFRLLEDSQVATHAAQGVAAQKATADPLRDFCTDIIMPFFAARLPELCDSINRKLGGPVIVSPPKPQQAKPLPKKHEAKPGAATKRPAPAAKSKTIERALYKENSRRSVSRGPGSTIALMRSATSSAIPGFKREASESSVLRTMAQVEDEGVRPKLLSRSSSVVAKEDNKAHKKALVEAELKDAISALRRPNREVVGKAIAEEAAERRASGGLSHIRKSKKPTRHPLFQGVQVKATPANSRFRDALATELPGGPLEASAIPPSSASIIPGTVRRSSTKDFLRALPSSSSAVKETPARMPAYPSVERSEEPVIPPSSPIMMRKTIAQPTILFPKAAARSRAGPLRSPSPGGMRRIFETPVKARSSTILVDQEHGDEIAATPIVKTTPITKKTSIYERLGWDDELDDLL